MEYYNIPSVITIKLTLHTIICDAEMPECGEHIFS